MPSTPFIGVRISWLMLARNCDFDRLAASAISLAARSSATAPSRSRFAWESWRVRSPTFSSRVSRCSMSCCSPAWSRSSISLNPSISPPSSSPLRRTPRIE